MVIEPDVVPWIDLPSCQFKAKVESMNLSEEPSSYGPDERSVERSI